MSRFAAWPREALISKLQADGMDIPSSVHPRDLIAFAQEFYAGQDVGPPPKVNMDTRMVDPRNGRVYVERPTEHARLRARHDSQVQRDAYDPFLFRGHTPTLSIVTEGMDCDDSRDARAADPELPPPPPPAFYAPAPSAPPPPAGSGGSVPTVREIELAEVQAIEEGHTNVSQGNPMRAGVTPYIYDKPRAPDAGFKEPDIVEAKRYAAHHHPRDPITGERYPLCGTTTGRHCFASGPCSWICFDPFREGAISELRRYGPGITLYFKFLKWLFWLFVVLSVITMPQVIVNAYGTVGSSPLSGISSTTLGNLADEDLRAEIVNGSITTQSTANRTVTVPILNRVLDRDTIGAWYLRYFEQSAGDARDNVAVQEYTVHILKVPPGCGEMALKKFFSHLTGEPVHEVSIAQNNGKLISLYIQRGKILNELWKTAARAHAVARKLNKDGNNRNQKKLMRRTLDLEAATKAYDEVYARFLTLNERLASTTRGNRSISAFVTFETQRGFLLCLERYRSKYLWDRLSRQPANLRLQGMRVKCRPAPPPSTILWENQEFTWCSRLTRRFLTAFVMLAALVGSILATYKAQNVRSSLNAQWGDAAAEGGGPEKLLLPPECIPTDPKHDAELCECALYSYPDAVNSLLHSEHPCHEYWSEKAPDFAYTILASFAIAAVNMFFWVIVRALSYYEKHHSMMNQELSVLKRIFVGQLINTAFVLLLVNANLKDAFDTQVFAFLGQVGIGSGQYSDFSTRWYADVGVQLITIQLINIVSPHTAGFGRVVRLWGRRKCFPAPITQRDLNERYLGTSFFLSSRLAMIMMIVFATMAYSGGIPILYPIAAAAFGIFFWVDKALLLRFFRTPPAYDDSMARWCSSTISWAVILHLCFTIWMFSVPGIFNVRTLEVDVELPEGEVEAANVLSFDWLFGTQSGDLSSFSSRIQLSATMPLLLLLCCIGAVKLLSICLGRVDIIRNYCCASVNCGLLDDGSHNPHFANPPYSEALENREVRGLDTYNVLRNPVYARAFAISEDFGKRHSHVNSVHHLPSGMLPKLPSS